MAKNLYHAKVKTLRANNGGKRQKFEKPNSNKKWLKTRHRIKHKLLR